MGNSTGSGWVILYFFHAHLLLFVKFVLAKDGVDSGNGLGDMAIYVINFYPDLGNNGDK